ncbi:MAG: dynamin family protein [Polyangiaceae bacterium]
MEALRARLSEGRFFVACVGQFKRGKSSLLNALVGKAVLPVGVIPVTAIVTVLRYGDDVRACVHFASGEPKEISLPSVSEYVSEKENPENIKGVSAVEVFVPSDLLRDGMCLVDTPGLGSVFSGNTDVTREFIPQIDAALVVIGADPPLSGAELELVEQTSKQIDRLVFVMNKADRLTDEEREQGRAFAEEMLRRRLARTVGPIFEVSTRERVTQGPTRDWTKLETALRELARAGVEVIEQAEDRGVVRFASALQRHLDEQRDALVRPQEESAQRIERLRRSVADAERTLSELTYLFTSVQDNLARSFESERERFIEHALPEVTAQLRQRIATEPDTKDLGHRAMETAQVLAKDAVETWRASMIPVAEKLYAQAVRRFVDIANDFLRRVADPNDAALAALPESFEPNLGFRTKAHFFFTDLLTIASPNLATLLGFTRDRRIAAITKQATKYLDRLMTTNSSRAANDFSEQVLESRRRVQAELRDHLRAVVSSAEKAVSRAREHRALGEDVVRSELVKLDRLSALMASVGSPTSPVSELLR